MKEFPIIIMMDFRYLSLIVGFIFSILISRAIGFVKSLVTLVIFQVALFFYIVDTMGPIIGYVVILFQIPSCVIFLVGAGIGGYMSSSTEPSKKNELVR